MNSELSVFCSLELYICVFASIDFWICFFIWIFGVLILSSLLYWLCCYVPLTLIQGSTSVSPMQNFSSRVSFWEISLLISSLLLNLSFMMAISWWNNSYSSKMCSFSHCPFVSIPCFSSTRFFSQLEGVISNGIMIQTGAFASSKMRLDVGILL